MNDPELDAIVERQLYEQRAAWYAANPQSEGQHHLYVPQVPAPAALPSSENAIAREPRGTMQLPTSSHLSASQNAPMAIPEPMHVQPGSGATMSEKTHLDTEERREWRFVDTQPAPGVRSELKVDVEFERSFQVSCAVTLLGSPSLIDALFVPYRWYATSLFLARVHCDIFVCSSSTASQ